MYRRIIEMPRAYKQVAILVVDLIAICVAIMIAIILRVSALWPEDFLVQAVPFFSTMLALGLIVSSLGGVLRIKLSTFDLDATSKIGLFALMLAAIGTVLNIAFGLGAPRTVPAIFGLVMAALAIGWRAAVLGALRWMYTLHHPQTPVAVYGAGAAGIQLISALNRSGDFRIVAVVDDNPNLRGVTIGRLSVQSPGVLNDLARDARIERILLALPSVATSRQREIVRRLEALPCEVQALPGYTDIVRSGGLTRSLKPVSSDDLLGRDAVALDIPEIAAAYRGKSVMISGAGGSIGSELCRQVLGLAPRRIVLFEASEFALYQIDRELRPLAVRAGVEVITVMGSVCDRLRVDRTLEAHGVEIVLHAAAYKHVPLVEANELEGVRNNVFGTRTVAEAARDAGCERFILISTDKAVRPTNIMGSTKRLAEMVVQDLARRAHGTRFAMVRFGNVLGSSGSVIPLFQSQINAGGPVTLTHPDVTRYFMTVPEAARLVLLAGSFAGEGTGGGDVFVLDMGRPVKIQDLARRMIELSGLAVRDAANPDGDIAIEVTGLRPGEKLYEELLIGEDGLLATPHPKILRAEEYCPGPAEISNILSGLGAAVEGDNPRAARSLIERWVEGYHQGTDTQPAPRIVPIVAAE